MLCSWMASSDVVNPRKPQKTAADGDSVRHFHPAFLCTLILEKFSQLAENEDVNRFLKISATRQFMLCCWIAEKTQ